MRKLQIILSNPKLKLDWDDGYYDCRRDQVVIKMYYVIRIISDDHLFFLDVHVSIRVMDVNVVAHWVNIVADASKRDDVGDNNNDSNKSCIMYKTPRVFSALNSSGIISNVQNVITLGIVYIFILKDDIFIIQHLSGQQSFSSQLFVFCIVHETQINM